MIQFNVGQETPSSNFISVAEELNFTKRAPPPFQLRGSIRRRLHTQLRRVPPAVRRCRFGYHVIRSLDPGELRRPQIGVDRIA
jgi:hypothetical protein